MYGILRRHRIPARRNRWSSDRTIPLFRRAPRAPLVWTRKAFTERMRGDDRKWPVSLARMLVEEVDHSLSHLTQRHALWQAIDLRLAAEPAEPHAQEQAIRETVKI